MRGDELPPDDDVMAYSNLIADGQSINQIDKVIRKKERKQMKSKMDESTATLEYSLMQAGNENESDKFKQEKQQESNDNNSNIQLDEEDTDENAPVKETVEKKWYENDPKPNDSLKVQMNKLTKSQQLEATHKALKSGQKAVFEEDDDPLDKSQDEDTEVLQESTIDLKNKQDVLRSKWP